MLLFASHVNSIICFSPAIGDTRLVSSWLSAWSANKFFNLVPLRSHLLAFQTPHSKHWSGGCRVSRTCSTAHDATHVEYSNNWNSPLQRSLPLQKLIGHFIYSVVSLGLLWYQRLIWSIRHLPGSWLRLPYWQSWEYSQGHYNRLVIIFMSLMATGNSLTDV